MKKLKPKSKELVQKLVEENLYIVEYFVTQYGHIDGVEPDDIRSAGHVGLMEGIEKLDLENGSAVSGFLRWHIYSWVMKDALYNNRNVRMPFNKINQQIKINKDDKGQKENILGAEISTDAQIEGSEKTSGDFLPELRDEETQKVLDADMFEPLITETLETSNLSDIEKFVLIHKVGLCGQTPKRLSEIASLTASSDEFKSYTSMGIKKAFERSINKIKKNTIIKEAYLADL